MITIHEFIEELSKDTQVPVHEILQIYYEGKLEQYLMSYFIEFHLTPQCTKACHHYDAHGAYVDTIGVGIDIDGVYIYIAPFVPNTIIKGHWAYFKVGNLIIEMSEDDEFWKSKNITYEQGLQKLS